MTESMTRPDGNLAYPEDWKTDEGNAECFAFQASMADRIGDGEDLQSHPHMATCERCRALVRDLEAIAIVARQLMPEDADPDEELWIKIDKKLALEDSQSANGGLPNRSIDASGAGIPLDGGLALEGGVA